MTAWELLQEHRTMFDNLTATQARCTELLLENRELKKSIREQLDYVPAPSHTLDQAEIRNLRNAIHEMLSALDCVLLTIPETDPNHRSLAKYAIAKAHEVLGTKKSGQ